MTRGLIFTCEKCSADSELFHSEWFFLGFSSGGGMRGGRPGIRTNLIITLGSLWWNVLRSAGDVGGYVLSWEYLYCQHQTGLSVTWPGDNISDGNIATLSLSPLAATSQTSINFLHFQTLDNSKSELGRRVVWVRCINKSGSQIYLINLTKLCIEFK